MIVIVQSSLALHADLDDLFDLILGSGHECRSVGRGGIGAGLKQPWHVFALVGIDRRGVRLQAYIGVEPGRDGIAVLLPPATLPRLPSDGEQCSRSAPSIPYSRRR